MFDLARTAPQGPATPLSVLSISGGGMLGVIPAAMLLRYEALGKAAYGDAYRLADSFDLVGGTSTGAIIATAVALGHSAADIVSFYLDDAPRAMRRRWGAIPFVHDLYDSDLMARFYLERTGGARLEPTALGPALAITVKDMRTARPAVFTSLAGTAPEILGATVRTDPLPLDALLRASTAAPFLFGPTILDLPGGETMPVVDGGLSPFNDPSLLLANLAWSAGCGGLRLTALGTGASRPSYGTARAVGRTAMVRALRALLGTIRDCETLVDDILGGLATRGGGLDYRRHDLALDAATFAALGFEVGRAELAAIRRFADCAGKVTLFEAARAHAEATITAPLPLAAGAMAAV